LLKEQPGIAGLHNDFGCDGNHKILRGDAEKGVAAGA
jgi:hypothetical protein